MSRIPFVADLFAKPASKPALRLVAASDVETPRNMFVVAFGQSPDALAFECEIITPEQFAAMSPFERPYGFTIIPGVGIMTAKEAKRDVKVEWKDEAATDARWAWWEASIAKAKRDRAKIRRAASKPKRVGKRSAKVAD